MQAGPGGLTIYSYYLEFSELKVTHYIRTDTIIKKAALVVIKTNMTTYACRAWWVTICG